MVKIVVNAPLRMQYEFYEYCFSVIYHVLPSLGKYSLIYFVFDEFFSAAINASF